MFLPDDSLDLDTLPVAKVVEDVRALRILEVISNPHPMLVVDGGNNTQITFHPTFDWMSRFRPCEGLYLLINTKSKRMYIKRTDQTLEL